MLKESDTMLKWNYESPTQSSNGYEDVLGELKTYTKEKYINASDEEKEKMIDDVFKIYRSKNIFPIIYYNENGVHKEIQKCIDKKVGFSDNILNLKTNYGQSLCKFLFPNMLNVESGNDKRTMYKKFYDDYLLKNTIKFCFRFRNNLYPLTIRNASEMTGGNVVVNFSPMKAKALYERYCPPNGVIYDYACGFGGRMLGALSSKNNYTYIGVEPCIETYTHLNELGLHIEHVTNRKDSYKLFCMGSEDYIGEENSIDFAFSSPPYFNLERYSDELTQCYNKFPTLEEWFEGYVKPTIENTYKMLKPNSDYAVNIADFKVGKNNIKFVERWIEIAENIGFEYREQIFMKLNPRKGDGHKNKNGEDKDNGESIFIFVKK